MTNVRTQHRQVARRGRARGFTITELLVAVTVLSIVTGISGMIFMQANRIKNEATRRADLTERGRVIVDTITNELQSALAVPMTQTYVETTDGEARFLNRYRFVGRQRMLPGTTVDIFEGEGPFLGRDVDGDGLIDEDPWNGIDDDGDGRIDEDPGLIPRDLLNFVATLPNRGTLDVVEVGYGLSPLTSLDNPVEYRTDRMYRRFRPYLPGQDNDDFGLFARNGEDLAFVVSETAFGTPERLESREVEVVDYDVVGLDFKYWYYDYGLESWAFAENWDSHAESATLGRQGDPLGLNNFGLPIINELEDLPIPGETAQETEARAALSSDGLPYMVETRVFIQDRQRAFPPRMFSSRVFLSAQ